MQHEAERRLRRVYDVLRLVYPTEFVRVEMEGGGTRYIIERSTHPEPAPHAEEGGMKDRITKYGSGDRATIDDRVDEIVATDTDVHLEMMHEGAAWLRVGRDVFRIHATRDVLTVRYSERRPAPTASPSPEPTP